MVLTLHVLPSYVTRLVDICYRAVTTLGHVMTYTDLPPLIDLTICTQHALLSYAVPCVYI